MDRVNCHQRCSGIPRNAVGLLLCVMLGSGFMLAPFPETAHAGAQGAPQATPVAPEEGVPESPPATEPAPTALAPDLPPPVTEQATPTLSLAVASDARVSEPVLASSTLLNADSPTGQVTYAVYLGEGCSGEPHAERVVAVNASSGLVPSVTVTFSGAGSYAWRAIYSGDATNEGASSACVPQQVDALDALTLVVTRGDTVAFGVLGGSAVSASQASDSAHTYVMSDAVTVEITGGSEPWMVTCSTVGGHEGVELAWQLAGTTSWTPFADGPCFAAVDGGDRTLTFHYRLRVDPAADGGPFAFDVTYEVRPLLLW